MVSQDLITAIVELREEEAISCAKQLLNTGVEPRRILEDAREAMEIVGRNFEEKLYFLPELIMAGEIMKQVSALARPYLLADMEAKQIGKIVFGTVEGDIHDIGKDIVVLMLTVYGFEVIDLGVDVSSARFIEKINEVHATMLGLSGFLYLAHKSMLETIDLLEKEGLHGRVKVMIGGGQVDSQVMKITGADAWGRDAMDAVNIAKKWISEGALDGNE
jgi:5-methyltetrahydrofolate--homocysteine methyltransferase